MRTALAVVVGYVTMMLLVFALLSAVYLAAGPDFAFLPGRYDVTLGWCVVMMVVGTDAAMTGGLVAALVAPGRRTATWLAALVVILGLTMAAGNLNAPDTPALAMRAGDVANLDAMMRARTPTWLLVVNPLLGVPAVFVGAWLAERWRGRATPPSPAP